MTPTPSSGAITIAFGGEVQNYTSFFIEECKGAALTNPIVQTVTAQDNGMGAAGAPLVTLAAFSDYWNATYGCFAGQMNTVGSGFTSVTSAGVGLLIEFKAANDTSIDSSGGASPASWCAIGIEVKAK